MLRRGGCILQKRRWFCSSSSSNDGLSGSSPAKVKIFDRHLKRKQRDRASWLMRGMNPKDPLVDTVAENVLDRLEDCKKTFPTALCLGGSSGAIRRLLRGRGSIEKLIMMDTSHDMLKFCQDTEQNIHDDSIETSYIVGDEEFLPVKESSVDIVISCLGLHWTNDLPGAMIQSRLALKPDGLFLAAIMGGETLKELRIACTIAQMEREGGISPRISPLAQVRDAGNLLTRAGFMLPGVDMDEYTVRYKSALDLIEHLRAMGETNALLQRHKLLKRETALATAAVYESMFAAEDGTIPATYQVIYMTGWREHSSQQQPKRRGSATVSFQDLQKQFGGLGRQQRKLKGIIHASSDECTSTNDEERESWLLQSLDTPGRRQLLAVGTIVAPWMLLSDQIISFAAETKKGFIGVTDKKDGYSLVYPFGWQEIVIEGQDKVFKDVIEPLENVSVNVFPTSKEDVHDLGSPQEVSEALIKKVLAPPSQKTKLIDAAEHDVDGKTYYTFEFVAKAPNFTRHALSAICIGNGKLYTVTTGANERRWGKMKDKLNTVIDSFKVFTVYET